MANFFSLIKVQFLSLFGINKLLNSKKSKRNFGIIGLIALLVLIMGAVAGYGYMYSEMFISSLILGGDPLDLVPIMLGVSAILSFILSFYSAGSSLFGFKDYDMLASMPIKPTAIVLSKFTFMYVVDFAFCALLSVPAIIVLATKGVTITVTYIVSTVVACLVSPLLPLALATLVSLLVCYVASKFKRKNLIQTVLFIILAIGILALSFVSGFISSDETVGVDVSKVIGKIYFIMPWLTLSTTNPLMILAFAGVNVVSAVIVVGFICIAYKKLNTILTAKKTSRNFKLKEYNSNSANVALFTKEIRRLFSCPAYAVNSLMGALLGIIMSIGYSVAYSVLKADIEFASLFNVFNCFVPVLFAFMFLMTPTTSASISVEGRAFWLLKTSPIPFKKLCNVKLSLNALFGCLPALIGALVIVICTGMAVYDGVLLVVIALSISAFGGVYGLILNLRFPKLDWKTETEAVKQGASILLSVLSAFVFAILLGAFALLTVTYGWFSITALYGIIAGVFVALTVALYIALIKKGEKLFNKIS